MVVIIVIVGSGVIVGIIVGVNVAGIIVAGIVVVINVSVAGIIVVGIIVCVGGLLAIDQFFDCFGCGWVVSGCVSVEI